MSDLLGRHATLSALRATALFRAFRTGELRSVALVLLPFVVLVGATVLLLCRPRLSLQAHDPSNYAALFGPEDAVTYSVRAIAKAGGAAVVILLISTMGEAAVLSRLRRQDRGAESNGSTQARR